jgi:dipeptidyl aminopeptidase/acylaminoacyl peptidase
MPTTFHLYHHHPDPLPLTAVADRAWLVNNAFSYSVVAVIEAPDAPTALHAAQRKAQGRPLPRATMVRAGNLLRETRPGDVLVTRTTAWMVDDSHHLHQLALLSKSPWRIVGLRSTIQDLAWSPDGRILAAAEQDRRVVLLTQEGNHASPPAYRRGEDGAAAHLAWSPDGARLASAGSGGEVHLWHPAPWRTTGRTTGATGSILICGPEEGGAFYSSIHCLAWTPDGRRILAGREDGRLIAWWARTGDLSRFQNRHQGAITALAFSPCEAHLLLTASADATVRVWNEKTGEEYRRFVHTKRVMAAVWAPDGTLIASCEQGDPTIALWHPHTGRLVARLPLSTYTTRQSTIHALAWSPDGSLLAAGCDDGTVQLMDLERCQHVQTYWTETRYQQTVKALAWSPNGALLAAGGTSASVKIWQVRGLQAPDTEAAPPPSREESAQ